MLGYIAKQVCIKGTTPTKQVGNLDYKLKFSSLQKTLREHTHKNPTWRKNLQNKKLKNDLYLNI